MQTFTCKKCGSVNVYIECNGTQTGLYCDDCGKWIKWLGKDEKRLVERWIENNKSVSVNVGNMNPKQFVDYIQTLETKEEFIKALREYRDAADNKEVR